MPFSFQPEMEIFGKSNLTFIKKYDIILKKDIIALGQRLFVVGRYSNNRGATGAVGAHPLLNLALFDII